MSLSSGRRRSRQRGCRQHADLEEQLEARGRELLRRLFQDRPGRILGLRPRSARYDVAGEDGVVRTRAEKKDGPGRRRRYSGRSLCRGSPTVLLGQADVCGTRGTRPAPPEPAGRKNIFTGLLRLGSPSSELAPLRLDWRAARAVAHSVPPSGASTREAVALLQEAGPSGLPRAWGCASDDWGLIEPAPEGAR